MTWSPSSEIDSQRTYGADVRVEVVGLLRTMSEPSFRFIAEMVHSILSYLDPPNTMLQSEDMDLLERCWSAEPPMEKRRRTINPAFDMYIVEKRIAQKDPNNEVEPWRLYFSCIDSVCGEIKERF